MSIKHLYEIQSGSPLLGALITGRVYKFRDILPLCRYIFIYHIKR